ncbi:37279_t:CDS:2, partial [Gigaspora margarita]
NIVPFETMRMLLGKAISIDLELLPDSPDLIPEHITEFLLFTLPISDHKQTRAVTTTLYLIYRNSEQVLKNIITFCIPPLYFDLPVPERKDLLPLTPQELPPNLRWLFLLDLMLSP